jgi:mannosyltransferase
MTLLQNRIKPIIQSDWPGILVVLIAIILRIYRLTAQPLWLDEIYSVQVSRQGLLSIFQNSLRVPNPPIYYIIQMLTSGLWNIQSEWGWRWLSVFWGVLTIAGFYLFCRRFSSRPASALASLIFAVSPFHIYYSQEARFYVFTTLLTVWSSILLADILSNPKSKTRWIALTILSLIGLYTSYIYLLIIGVQGFTLLVHARQREWWIYTAIITVFTGLAAFMIVPTISSSVQNNINSQPLSLLASIQSLAGEPVRFGIKWQHWLMMGVVGVTALLGAFIATRQVKKGLLGSYIILQLLLPLLVLSGLATLMNIRLPSFESRQLLIFLPALFSLIAVVLDFSFNHLHWAFPILLCSLILIASGASLYEYWHITKSPEGSLVLSIRTEIISNDTVISLDYSTTAAAYFYLSGVHVLRYLSENKGINQFTYDLILSPLSTPGSAPIANVSMTDIRNSSRIWILNRNGINANFISSLTDQCSLTETTTISPFTATLWENCLP